MVTSTLEQQILEQVHRLDDEQKRELLNYARMLSQQETPRGTPAEEFIASAIAANFDHKDLQEITQATEEDCERIDADWATVK